MKANLFTIRDTNEMARWRNNVDMWEVMVGHMDRMLQHMESMGPGVMGPGNYAPRNGRPSAFPANGQETPVATESKPSYSHAKAFPYPPKGRYSSRRPRHSRPRMFGRVDFERIGYPVCTERLAPSRE
jgi:hypothetical protein